MTEDWARLGDHIVAARVRRGLPTRAAFGEHLASIGHKVTDRTLSKIESGQRVGRSTLVAIEIGLGWKTGSCRAVLAGGEPTPESQPVAARREGGDDAYPGFVGSDPGFRMIWNIPDDLMPPHEREYAILSVTLHRATAQARTEELRQRDAGDGSGWGNAASSRM